MEFKKLKLGDIIEFKNGKKRPKENGNIPIYGGNGILGYTNVSNSKKNALIIGRVGAYCGCVYKNDDECWISDNAIMGKVREKNDYIYTYYLMKSLNIHNLHIGSGQPLMTQEILNKIDVNIPEYKIQIKTAKILSTIDKKIELNNQINDNLLKIIKSIYKEKYYLKEDKKVLIVSLVKETIGGDWGKEKIEGNYIKEVFCVRGADLPQMTFGNKGKVPTRFIIEKNYSNKKLVADEIIIEISGGSPTQSTGRVAFVSKSLINKFEKPIICTNFCRAIVFNDNIYAPYVYTHLLSLYDDKIFFNYENGTTGIKNLSLKDFFNNQYIYIPSYEEVKEFYKVFNSIFNKIVENSAENERLLQLRNTLLPKLMNGEIDLDKIEI